MKTQLGIIFRFIGEVADTVIIALVVFLLLYFFVAQPHKVVGSSMFPNLENGEYILTEKLSYRFGSAERGDVVVLKAPASAHLGSTGHDYLIKRVIGLPSETVKFENDKVIINGQVLNEPYLDFSVKTVGGSEVVLGASQYFVMGDNRSDSYDSRAWGPLEQNLIVGKAFFVYWPVFNAGELDGARLIKHENYGQ